MTVSECYDYQKIFQSHSIFFTQHVTHTPSRNFSYAKSLEPFYTTKRNLTFIAFLHKKSYGTYLFSADLSREKNIFIFWGKKCNTDTQSPNGALKSSKYKKGQHYMPDLISSKLMLSFLKHEFFVALVNSSPVQIGDHIIDVLCARRPIFVIIRVLKHI